ncbi:hypothetical protein P171DRAFT_427153 [Karstenula rhodostoma CBS 690.94]|uniref:Uncharacterized protein n=1 Tax=Karstenula rhodostoma CBS 690.94 TaxID=1392251 RepID=A0A9P4PV62_9PLEO|nr:hypothetical protein P171DRAFT_427153 [Karstenula rhodostoma CBS 690.94]
MSPPIINHPTHQPHTTTDFTSIPYNNTLYLNPPLTSPHSPHMTHPTKHPYLHPLLLGSKIPT